VTFIASWVFSRSVDGTKAHDITLVGGASFNGGIFLVAAVVDRALKGSMTGERMNKIFGRELGEKEMSSTTQTLSSQWVECNGKRPSRKRPRYRPGGQEVWPTGHTLPPKTLAFFPKFLCESLNSLLPLILEIWKENFEKKILKKRIPKLGITTLFRSRNLWM
jgi:hypothetical protein